MPSFNFKFLILVFLPLTLSNPTRSLYEPDLKNGLDQKTSLYNRDMSEILIKRHDKGEEVKSKETPTSPNSKDEINSNNQNKKDEISKIKTMGLQIEMLKQKKRVELMEKVLNVEKSRLESIQSNANQKGIKVEDKENKNIKIKSNSEEEEEEQVGNKKGINGESSNKEENKDLVKLNNNNNNQIKKELNKENKINSNKLNLKENKDEKKEIQDEQNSPVKDENAES